MKPKEIKKMAAAVKFACGAELFPSVTEPFAEKDGVIYRNFHRMPAGRGEHERGCYFTVSALHAMGAMAALIDTNLSEEARTAFVENLNYDQILETFNARPELDVVQLRFMGKCECCDDEVESWMMFCRNGDVSSLLFNRDDGRTWLSCYSCGCDECAVPVY